MPSGNTDHLPGGATHLPGAATVRAADRVFARTQGFE
jgi:hypothetical protein